MAVQYHPEERKRVSWLIVAHYGLAALGLLVLPWLQWELADELHLHYFNPHTLATLHLAVLGWLLPVTFGALYQVGPLVAGGALYSRWLVIASMVLYFPGIVMLVWAFWQFRTGGWLITGGSLAVAGVLILCINLWLTLRQGKREVLQGQYIGTSLLWLLLTVLLGLLLAINFTFPFLTMDHLRLLKVHAHLGLIGWFVQLAIGGVMQLVPMFLIVRPVSQRWLNAGYYSLNLGLVAVMMAFLLESDWLMAAGILGIALGIGGFLHFGWQNFRGRVRKAVDFPMKMTGAAGVLLVLSLVAGVLVYFFAPDGAFHLRILYVYWFVMGFLTCLILAQSYKVLPLEVFSHHITKRGKLQANDLYLSWLLYATFACFFLSLALGSTGIVLNSGILFKISADLLAFAGLGHAVNYVRMVWFSDAVKQ